MVSIAQAQTPRPSPTSRISSFTEDLWPVDKAFTATRSTLVDGRFSAPTDRRTDAPLVIDWAALHDRPDCIFDRDAQQEKLFTIIPDGNFAQQLDFDGLFVKKRSSKLLVVLHGALDREKYMLPRLEYQRSLKDFDGSIIYIQDPTLYVHQKLTLGWYIGTELDDGHSMLEQLIREAVRVLQPKQLVIAGSSGGGFASLAVSARIPGSSALVFSPQTSVEKYNIGHRRRLMSSAFPNLRPNFANLSAMEDRLDMGALYSKGSKNRIFYLQNTGDPFHMKNHCIPFMEHAGLNLLEGEMRNARMKVECRYLSDGHNAPRPNQLRLYVNRVFDGGF